MKKALMSLSLILLAAGLLPPQSSENSGRTLLGPEVLRAVVNEASGELAFQNEVYLAGVNRNRKPQEYQKGYFETAFILDRLKEYGITDSSTIDLPVREKSTWDAEAAELWMVEPEARKITDLTDVPACLCSGSASADVTAELIYVGPGNREDFYKDKNVEGKILLVNGSPEGARRLGVEKFGAAGLVGWASSHPEFDRDEVGWSGIRTGEKEKPTFGFMISQRQGQDLRDLLERGRKIVLRAAVKAGRVENFKDQMTAGLIRGSEFPDEELVFTAHLFEGWAKQGANDDISGCTAILETARVLRKLVSDGKIPPLKRSVRFLFIPEISGTAAYLELFPEIKRKMFADINLDMVGEGLVKNQSYLRLHQTPWSLPTYLNDVMASYYEWMGETQKASLEAGWRTGGVLAPTGSRDPFYYQIEGYSGGSDHDVFIDGHIRIPAVMMIVWPDQWYHTSGDTVDKSDPTQFKRVVAISAAAAITLANAGPAEAERIMGELAMRQMGRLGQDKAKAERLLNGADAKTVHVQAKEARVVINQSFAREKEALASVRFFVKGDRGAEAALQSRLSTLEGLRAVGLKGIDDLYASRCLKLSVKAEKPVPTKDEVRTSRLVPVRTKKMGGLMQMWELRGEFAKLDYKAPMGIMRAEMELRNFIDGRRSILDIRDAASAEFEPIALKDVEEWVNVQAKLGLVEIKKK